ncbi:uncharacterized protein EV154DRAFT_477556 [Mucor mucedo]|uniref:uncharacterized protein n=1 Tax=Mucor mucedo TaxID=29922 RepID=UPI00221F9B2E|nr:uncharacterized protein EV154DRAFT_477556 [Mucor mucedo]KAI7895430.1 hypothetical protein EV154DRAFT_477556 [Mucor mucedo]
MTNTKSPVKTRGQAPASSSKASDLLKPSSNGTGFKSTVADPKSELLRKKQLATATARQLVPSPEASSVTLVTTSKLPKKITTSPELSQESEFANATSRTKPPLR